MNRRQAKMQMGFAGVVTVLGLGFIFTGSETWWVVSAIGLINLLICIGNYVSARRRERHPSS